MSYGLILGGSIFFAPFILFKKGVGDLDFDDPL
jgi:hypothetical protein